MLSRSCSRRTRGSAMRTTIGAEAVIFGPEIGVVVRGLDLGADHLAGRGRERREVPLVLAAGAARPRAAAASG